MILLHILTDNEQMASEIADYLVEDHLVVDALITKGNKIMRDARGKAVTVPQILIRGKTKALLFDKIDNLLKEKYGEKLPTIYSVPIVHMDWEQAARLREQTKPV